VKQLTPCKEQQPISHPNGKIILTSSILNSAAFFLPKCLQNLDGGKNVPPNLCHKNSLKISLIARINTM